MEDFVDTSQFFEWSTSARSFLANTFGQEDVHYRQFEKECETIRFRDADAGQGILKAAKAAIDGGHLNRFEDLVSADIFTDFLEMAEYLLENGYRDPAASLIGAVLEDGLRRIAKGRGVKTKSREDIQSLSGKLADNGVYNRLVQKQLDVWNEVRNNADHGHFEEYNQADVTAMLLGVRDFLANHL